MFFRLGVISPRNISRPNDNLQNTREISPPHLKDPCWVEMWWAGRLFVGPSFSPLKDSKTYIIFETPTSKESFTLQCAICEYFVISDIYSQSHWRTFPRRETQNTGFVYNCWKQAVIFGYHNRQEREKHKNVEKNINLDNCKILPVDDVSDDIYSECLSHCSHHHQ